MYDLKEALKEQIKYCHELERYRCGAYITDSKKKDFIIDILKELLKQDDRVDKVINGQYDTVVYFKNGSFIKIIRACENARGHKNHGAIIDNEIEREILNCIILPTLIPRWSDKHTFESWEEVKKRIFYCNI